MYHILKSLSVGSYQTPSLKTIAIGDAPLRLPGLLRFEDGSVLVRLRGVKGPFKVGLLDEEIVDEELPAEVDGNDGRGRLQIGRFAEIRRHFPP